MTRPLSLFLLGAIIILLITYVSAESKAVQKCKPGDDSCSNDQCCCLLSDATDISLTAAHLECKKKADCKGRCVCKGNADCPNTKCCCGVGASKVALCLKGEHCKGGTCRCRGTRDCDRPRCCCKVKYNAEYGKCGPVDANGDPKNCPKSHPHQNCQRASFYDYFL